MADLSRDVVEAATKLTRRARQARTEETAERHRDRRADLLGDHGYTARVREEGDDLGSSLGTGGSASADREVLVLYPQDWVDDGTVRPGDIEDLDRAAEIPLSGPGDPDDWDALDARNRRVVERVREQHGDVHGDNAAAFADFVGNHYAKPIEQTTPDERREFLEEYYPRNVWPGDEQREAVEESVEFAVDAAEALQRDA
jgi:hypothetical protein